MGAPHGRVGTALITGASSGIGAALARRFAQEGHPLVLVARSRGKLVRLAESLARDYGVKVRVQTADLAKPDAARALYAALRRQRVTVDILVNNAGVLEQGRFTAVPERRHRDQIDLNVSGVTAMLAQFLPAMSRRRRGRVLNVASIAAFQPVPMLATYAATKAFVLSLSESLSEELRESGVSVTALCPGITATHMLKAATAANAGLAKLPGILIGDAAEVADEGYRACMQGVAIKVPGAINQAVTLASRATPKAVLRRVAAALTLWQADGRR